LGRALDTPLGFFSARGKLLASFPDIFNPPPPKDGAKREKAPDPCDDARALYGEWVDIVAALALHTGWRMSVVGDLPLWEGLTLYRAALDG
jgi:hypothetical protein